MYPKTESPNDLRRSSDSESPLDQRLQALTYKPIPQNQSNLTWKPFSLQPLFLCSSLVTLAGLTLGLTLLMHNAGGGWRIESRTTFFFQYLPQYIDLIPTWIIISIETSLRAIIPYVAMHRETGATDKQSLKSTYFPYPSRFLNLTPFLNQEWLLSILYLLRFWVVFAGGFHSVLIQQKPFREYDPSSGEYNYIWRWTPFAQVRWVLLAEYVALMVLVALLLLQTKYMGLKYTGLKRNPLTWAARAEMLAYGNPCDDLVHHQSDQGNPENLDGVKQRGIGQPRFQLAEWKADTSVSPIYGIRKIMPKNDQDPKASKAKSYFPKLPRIFSANSHKRPPPTNSTLLATPWFLSPQATAFFLTSSLALLVFPLYVLVHNKSGGTANTAPSIPNNMLFGLSYADLLYNFFPPLVTVILTFWVRSVATYIKVTQPVAALKSPKRKCLDLHTARETLVLDYTLSPILISLYSAFARKHYLVLWALFSELVVPSHITAIAGGIFTLEFPQDESYSGNAKDYSLLRLYVDKRAFIIASVIIIGYIVSFICLVGFNGGPVDRKLSRTLETPFDYFPLLCCGSGVLKACSNLPDLQPNKAKQSFWKRWFFDILSDREIEKLVIQTLEGDSREWLYAIGEGTLDDDRHKEGNNSEVTGRNGEDERSGDGILKIPNRYGVYVYGRPKI